MSSNSQLQSTLKQDLVETIKNRIRYPQKIPGNYIIDTHCPIMFKIIMGIIEHIEYVNKKQDTKNGQFGGK